MNRVDQKVRHRVPETALCLTQDTPQGPGYVADMEYVLLFEALDDVFTAQKEINKSKKWATDFRRIKLRDLRGLFRFALFHPASGGDPIRVDLRS